MRNVSPHATRWCHWSRTFAQGGRIAIVPLSPQSRFPKGWVRYGPGPAINFRPEDPHVRRRGDFVEVLGPLQHPKLGFDSAAGWLAYRFPAPGQEVDLDAIASRVAGLA